MMTKVRASAPRGIAQITLMKRRASRKIDNYDLLIEGICHRASSDLLGNNLKQKIDAMDFFRSEWFYLLSNGLNGNDVIERLLGGK